MNDTKITMEEDTKNDWMKIVNKHKKRQKGLPALSSLNTDAGNVEHNVSAFNNMNTPATSPSTNPVSGPFGEACVSESLKQDTVELEYKKLRYNPQGLRRDVDDWDDWDIVSDFTYEVDEDEFYSFIFEDCIDETDFPRAFEDDFHTYDENDWAEFKTWVDNNFSYVYNKYESKILDHWREAAIEEAEEEYSPSNPWLDEGVKSSIDDNFDMSMRTLL